MATQHTIKSVIGLYPSTPAIGCYNYDPRARQVARRVADLVTARLPGIAVEHIGSTAVPGCAGKGIVDLMIAYASAQLDVVKDALAALGFQRQTMGHLFPEDRPMRVGTLAHAGSSFRLHLHVIAASSPEVASLRAFRDRLRADPALLAAYVAQKREIVAAGVQTAYEYTARKGTFIQAMHAAG